MLSHHVKTTNCRRAGKTYKFKKKKTHFSVLTDALGTHKPYICSYLRTITSQWSIEIAISLALASQEDLTCAVISRSGQKTVAERAKEFLLVFQFSPLRDRNNYVAGSSGPVKDPRRPEDAWAYDTQSFVRPSGPDKDFQRPAAGRTWPIIDLDFLEYSKWTEKIFFQTAITWKVAEGFSIRKAFRIRKIETPCRNCPQNGVLVAGGARNGRRTAEKWYFWKKYIFEF